MYLCRCLPLLLVAAAFAPAQRLVNPESLPERWRSFERSSRESQLQCRISPVKPGLNLGFRFQAGYRVEVPMKQYRGEGHWLSMIVRVTPQVAEREPAWLVSKVKMPNVPDTKAVAELGGGYVVGEGAYRVDVLLVDDADRTCTADWTMNAKFTGQAREVRPGLAPGMVDDLSLRRSRMLRRDQRNEFKVAVLLHATPSIPGRVRLRDYDRMLLLSALSSLAERLPADIRLTVFNMERQSELYSAPELSRDAFFQTAQVLNELELGKVDYAVLKNRTGHIDLLSNLLTRETTEDRPDAVVVIGAVGLSSDRIALEANGVPVYYIQLRPWRMLSVGADSISQAVKSLGGKTKAVYSPEDFAEAIRDIEGLLQKGVGTASRRAG